MRSSRFDEAAGRYPRRVKIAVVTNDHNYVGREYSAALDAAGIRHDVLRIGTHPETNEIEEARCGGLWRPLPQDPPRAHAAVHRFASLADPALLRHLDDASYDLGVQGGTGILKPAVFERFRLGMLNIHPGRLPAYRGCSAPEWQLWEGRPITLTCHLVDAGIDTGPILAMRTLDLQGLGYAATRARIYPEAAAFLVDEVRGILDAGGAFPRPPVAQGAEGACYRDYIGDERIDALRERMARPD